MRKICFEEYIPFSFEVNISLVNLGEIYIYITDGYPALRSIQKKNTDESPDVVAAVDTTFESRLKKNMDSHSSQEGKVSSLKMDEIARDDRLRWSKQDNKMYGVCFQHGYKYSMDLNEIDDAKRVQELLNTDLVHRCSCNRRRC